jgi:hypothetical protein
VPHPALLADFLTVLDRARLALGHDRERFKLAESNLLEAERVLAELGLDTRTYVRARARRALHDVGLQRGGPGLRRTRVGMAGARGAVSSARALVLGRETDEERSTAIDRHRTFMLGNASSGRAPKVGYRPARSALCPEMHGRRYTPR